MLSSGFLVVLLSLLGGASAGRRHERARRRGFNEAFIEDLNQRQYGGPGHHHAHGNESEFRFLSHATEKYRVRALPDMPFDVGELYSGLIPIDMHNKSRSLFFVFQPTVGEPVDEVTIWLNGGPGCSSLEGFLQETGEWVAGQSGPPDLDPDVRDHTADRGRTISMDLGSVWQDGAPAQDSANGQREVWLKTCTKSGFTSGHTSSTDKQLRRTNVLWVEQPIGVGFSTGTPTATSEADVAKDFVDFFVNFEKIFGIKNFKIYVTGESYAGIYVPYISAEMLDRKDPDHLSVHGNLIYDPCIGSWVWTQQQAVAVPWIQQNNNILGLNASFLAYLDAQDRKCGYAACREQYLTFPASGEQEPKYFNSTSDAECDLWTMGYNAAYHTNPCFNVYEPNLQCPLLSDPLGYPTDLQYQYPGLPVYFDRTDVKRAMHAPLDVTWIDCSPTPVFVGGSGGPEDEGDLSPDPIQSVLPRIIEATNRVLIANGALDYDVITNGTLISIQNMTWNGRRGFEKAPSKPIDITLPDLQYQDTFESNGWGAFEEPMGIMGTQHFERGLMFAETLLSGHMEPQFQPRVSYRHLQWLLGRIEEL